MHHSNLYKGKFTPRMLVHLVLLLHGRLTMKSASAIVVAQARAARLPAVNLTSGALIPEAGIPLLARECVAYRYLSSTPSGSGSSCK